MIKTKAGRIVMIIGIVFAVSVVVLSTNFSERTIFNAIFDGTDAINVNFSQENITGNMAVSGTATVTGATALNGGLAMDTNAFTVADTSGNVVTAGTLTVAGTAALNNGITVDSTAFTVANTSGNTGIAGTLTVTGATALNGGLAMDTNAFTVADTSGNTAIAGTLALTGDMTNDGNIAFEQCTIADGDATPSVAGCQILTTSANTGATEITDLDNPVPGSVYIIVGGSDTNSSTITDGGNFKLSGNFTAAANDTLILYCVADNNYIQLATTNN